MSGGWSVEFHPACEKWAEQLDQPDAEALLAAIRILRDQGPTLGRPLVDTVKGSKLNNLKELRPGSTGRTEVRVLFAFVRERQAILLVGGDKSGDWRRWYEQNIPVAEARFTEHQGAVAANRRPSTTSGKRTKRPETRRGKKR